MKANKLIIRNIGPINNIEINLNKINVFIGAQGSGKSTIVKIISFCSWVEKKIALTVNVEPFLSESFFYDKLVSFHKLYGYFSYDSYFEFESDVILIKYKHSKPIPEIILKNLENYAKAKISYIPSERNIVASIPNWFDVKFEKDNNIRSFMSDWETARKRRNENIPLTLLNGKVQYSYEEQRDIVTIDSETKIDLTNTASGFQSLIPLFVVAEYSAKYLYEEESDESIRDVNQLNNRKFRLIQDYLTSRFRGEKFEDILNKVKNVTETINGEIGNDAYTVELLKAFKLSEKLLYTKASKIIIEEIEQNLFPETQKLALYSMFALAKDSNVSLALTTHSPYVLFAINNCLLGGIVRDNIPQEEIVNFPSANAWIDPDLVSIWQITEVGEVIPIINEKTRTIGKHYFSQIMNDVMNEYYELSDYINDEE